MVSPTEITSRLRCIFRRKNSKWHKKKRDQNLSRRRQPSVALNGPESIPPLHLFARSAFQAPSACSRTGMVTSEVNGRDFPPRRGASQHSQFTDHCSLLPIHFRSCSS